MVNNVVQSPSEHQQNLRPTQQPSHWTIVAIPRPEIARRLYPEHFLKARSSALDKAAVSLGGGGGPCEIIDLEHTTNLTQCIDALQQSCAGIAVWGRNDRPSWFRELQCRWPHSFMVLEDGVSDWLHDRSQPLFWITPTFVRCLEGAAAPDGVDAIYAQMYHPHKHGYALDPQRVLGAWAGLAPPEVAVNTQEGARLRARWQRHWNSWDGFCEGILGFDPSLEMALWDHSPRKSSATTLIAVTGIDGSGKSTHVDNVCDALLQRGQRVSRFKLYRQGAFLQLADELSARTIQGAPLASFRSSRLVKLTDTLRVIHNGFVPQLTKADVFVMDRYLETHIAAAQSQLGWDIQTHPFLNALPEPHLQIWLQLKTDVALQRLQERDSRRTADEHPTGLLGYAECFQTLAHRSCDLLIDAQDDLAVNQQKILTAIEPLIDSTEAGSVYEYPIHDGGYATNTECHILLSEQGLGQELHDIFLEHPDIVEQSTRSDLIESWFWSVVLEILKERPHTSKLALWPCALRKVTGFTDLMMLDEVGRQLLSLATVSLDQNAFAVQEIPLLRLIAPSDSAYRRLKDEYQKALYEEAKKYGWLHGTTNLFQQP